MCACVLGQEVMYVLTGAKLEYSLFITSSNLTPIYNRPNVLCVLRMNLGPQDLFTCVA